MLNPLTEVDSGSTLEQLYREHAGRLERSLVLLTGDQEIARDAVAESFAQALRRGDALHSPLGWIWHTAFLLASGELKRRGRIGGDVPERAYEMPEPAHDLVVALSRLSTKQRASVVLHHYAGYSAREIARIIGSTSSAVYVHLTRGRKRLREALEEHHE